MVQIFTIINMVNATDFIPPDSEDNGSSQSGGISSNASLSDPNSTWDFTFDDPQQLWNLQNFMPVIVWDENAPAIGGIPTVPAMNFARNVLLETSGLWTISGALAALVTFAPGGPNVTMTFANNAVGYGLTTQQTLPGYVQPNVQYMFSTYVQGSGTINNIQAYLELAFLDQFGVIIGSTTFTTITPTSSNQRITCIATAPSGAAYALYGFAGETINATNSGEISFGTPQLEPMWFKEYGISYPTPDCNFAQVNSVIMPDGTTSRACRRFAGYIENRVNGYVGTQRHTAVQCASSSKLLETIGLISASYTNTLDTTILNDVLALLPANTNSIIGQIATGQQHYFGPTSTLIPGVTIPSISWNNATPRQVCNDLGAQSGSIFYIDPYYYLWYVPPSFSGATIMLSDTPDNIVSFAYAAFTVEYDSTNPVNTALVAGSKQKAAVFTDTFSGNGSQTLFDLSFPPENTHLVTVGGSNIRTGVDGVNNANFGASSTYKALINKQNQTIQFATAPASAANNTIVAYTYEDQVISQVLAADAIAQQKCQFWGLVNDSAITSTPAAKNRGLAELQAYAFERTILNLDALNIYLPVGSLILFTNQSEGLTNAPFIVRTVASDLKGGGQDNWQYTAGVYNPTIIDHLRNTTKAIQKTPTTANVVVVASIDVALFDSLHINDSIVINHNGAPPAAPYVYGASWNDVAKLSSPARWYKLKDTTVTNGSTIVDSGSQAQNGTVSGSGLSSVAGLITSSTDTAIGFGSSSAISIPTTGLPSAGAAYSIGAWCYPTDGSGTPYAIAAFGTFAANEIALLYYDGAFHLSNSNVSADSGAQAANARYFVVATFDGTNGKLYVNGSIVATTAFTGNNIVLGTAYIGARDPGTRYFAGDIQAAFIHTVALSAGEISILYNTGISTAVGALYGFASYS